MVPPPPASRPTHRGAAVLPIVALVLVVPTAVVPFAALMPMIYSYTGDAAAYGVHAVAVTLAATALCWALALAVIVVASVALARRHRMTWMSVTAIVLAAVVGLSGPVVYLLLALSADAY